jgi:Carboxypeptidase regulatory-like domain
MRLGLARRVISLLFAAAMFLCARSYAQSTNATVTGQVTDQSGRLVPGAVVMFTNINTAVPYKTETNGEGIYSLAAVQPGVYRANITKDGFKSIVKPDIEIHVQDQVSINFALQIGSVSETVTVEAGGLVINTTDASVSTVVDQSYIENMPLNGRSLQDLILLTPGTTTQTPQVSQSTSVNGVGQTGEFSVNGQRPESNYYTVDGVSGNVGATTDLPAVGLLGAGPSGSIAASTALGTTQALVSVDDLQEFRVQSSTYSAEYGRNPGGQFSFETKSGANQWHGTAYDYLRNGYFDAQDWFNDYYGTPEPALRQNDFGGTLGGPIEIPSLYDGKDKTFFFVSYEGLRLTAPQEATANIVPDSCLRGVAADCTGTNIPAPPVLQGPLNAFPEPSPNGLDFGNGSAQYIGSWSNPASIDSTSVRFDHLVSDKLRLFFRFSDTTSSSATRGGENGLFSPTVDQTSAYTLRTYTAGASSAFSNRVTNDFRINYSSNAATTSIRVDAFGGSTPVNVAELSGLPSDAGSNFFLCLESCFSLYQQRSSGAQKQWNLVDTASLSLGHHQLKFGVDYRRLTPFVASNTPDISYFFFSESAVETNSPLTSVFVLAPSYPLYMNFSAFAQDEWRLSQRLSLSLGLRWEVNPAPGVTQGLRPYTLQGSSPDTVTLAPQGTPLWRTSWYNFAPRLGAAYVLQNGPGRETVVRGGFGVFFDTGQQLGSQGFYGAGFYVNTPYTAAPFPLSAEGLVPPVANSLTPPLSNVYGFAPHLQLPYTLQWNASVEQALGGSQALTVSYVGAHAARLLQDNAVEPADNPNITFYNFIESGLTSDYNALQVQFRRRLSRGLTALASYTWSHCIDYGSQDYILGYQRGNCDFDVRHNLSAAFSYDLPNVGHGGFVDTVLHHWGLDDRFTARTAFPVTLFGNELLQPNGQLYDAGLSLTGQPVYLYGANCENILAADLPPGKGCPGGRAINPNAFMSVDSGLGDAPRNFARGLGAWQMDMAVRRDFPIYERLKLQFRAEAFNIFNHPNFGTIDAFFGDSTFGQFKGTLASSLGVLSPLYQQGGPRSMQFALKLIF